MAARRSSASSAQAEHRTACALVCCAGSAFPLSKRPTSAKAVCLQGRATCTRARLCKRALLQRLPPTHKSAARVPMRAMAPPAPLAWLSHCTCKLERTWKRSRPRHKHTRRNSVLWRVSLRVRAPSSEARARVRFPHAALCGPKLGSFCSLARGPCSCAGRAAWRARRCTLWPVSARGPRAKLQLFCQKRLA